MAHTAAIEIDYAEICKEYNTAYLDRDNKDPATSKCMHDVKKTLLDLFEEFLEKFPYKIYRLNGTTTTHDEIVSNRFLFYSLEKEITLQSFVIHTTSQAFSSQQEWIDTTDGGILIQNDEDGGCLYIYAHQDSPEQKWITQRLHNL
jgi:hypothetical protein